MNFLTRGCGISKLVRTRPRILIYYGHVKNIKNEPRRIIDGKQPGTRKRGRSPTTWRKQIQKIIRRDSK